MPSNVLVDRDMEADLNGRNPPSDHRLLPGEVPCDIAGERADVFWWENVYDDAGVVTGRKGRWYPAVVHGYDADKGTLTVRYYAGGVVGGKLSRKMDAIDIAQEHVYLVPDERSETNRVRRPRITRALAHAHTQPGSHTHSHPHAVAHSRARLPPLSE